MPGKSETTTKELAKVVQDLAGLVHRAMLETAELQDIEERVTKLGERFSKITPPPEEPNDPPDRNRG
jgi:hypothetical protein